MSVSTNALQLSEYLEKLPGTTFRRLYQQPSTAFAIFRRMLPHLAKTIVMAILYMPDPFLLADLDVWVKPSSKRQKDQAIAVLRSLHIIQISAPSKDTQQSMSLTANFKSSMRLALEGGGDHNSFGVPSHLPVPPDVDLPFLDRYARKKWDDILHFVVNSVGFSDMRESKGEAGNGPKASVKELLVAGRLVEKRNAITISITQAGFTFLLQEANSQVWTLLLLWLEAADATRERGADHMDSVDMLSFLFLLASLELGRGYSTEALTESRRNMLPTLVDFGLIYIPPHDHRQYFPTRLATTLTSSDSSLRSVSAGFSAATDGGVAETGDKNAIILETNFRMYAYTSSPLQIAVLALFCELKMRFRELVSGKLSRQSIRRAVDMGITSDQIISYLATHAHEQMYRVAAATKKPLLPPVIVDQIRLWQLDTERMSTCPGFLFKDFESVREYETMANFADEIGVLKWRNDRKGMFFANKVEQIKDFMKNRRKAEQ